jgi:hypothetical protein
VREYAIWNDFSNPIGTHDRSAPFVSDHVHASGLGNSSFGSKVEPATGLFGSAVDVSCTIVSRPSTT